MPERPPADKAAKLNEFSRADGEAEESLPRRFGRLTLLKLIARGGMGEVFLATAGGIEGAERPCVVKIIRREHADDRSFLARFLDEARIQAALHHPGVAQIVEAATDDGGKPFVVVEHIEGRNLGEVRYRAGQLGVRIGWPEAVALAVTLGEALAHVHERTDPGGRPLEIVHRDLSPQNVMVGYAGEVKLIDFGTARGENRRCHTVAGIVFAKPGYVAPEVANNTPGGIPADLYAWGVMLWELIAGRRFLTGDAAEHMAAVGDGSRNPEPLAPTQGCPAAIDAVIARLTATRLDERYASARAAVADLVAVLKTAPTLADGERSVRARIAHLMQRLWPAEPARSRGEFHRLLAAARNMAPPRGAPPPPSPPPPPSARTPVDPAVLPGTRWKLVGELGDGASGTVHEAVHLDLPRTVALKLMTADGAGSAAALDRFRAEARAVAALDHPNVVKLHDFGVSQDGRPFLAMELLAGETLDRVLARRGPLPWAEVVSLGRQAAAALAAAHAAGVVHRDVKPANLFLTEAGQLKLLDFGLASVVEAHDADDEAVRLVGTPEYAAPEVASGGPGDARADLYSLGVVLFELLTGTLPTSGSSVVALLSAKQHPPKQTAAQRAPERGIPAMLDRTVQRSLETDPNDRFQDAAAFGDALGQAAAPPPRPRRGRTMLAAGAIAAALLGFGAVGLVKGGFAGGVAAAPAAAPEVMGEEQGVEIAAAEAPLEAEQAVEVAAQPAPAAVEGSGEGEEGVEGEDEAPGEVVAAEPAAATAGEAPATEPATAAVEQGEGEAEGEAEAQPSADGDQIAAAAPAAEAAPAPEAAAEAAPAPAAKPCKGMRCIDVEKGIAEAHALVDKGQRVKGFNLMRKIGKAHRKDARVLKAWSEMAGQMKAWGEALRVARAWAAVDASSEAWVHLARMQRACGKPKEAVATLAKILQENPQDQDARALMRLYSDAPRVARR